MARLKRRDEKPRENLRTLLDDRLNYLRDRLEARDGYVDPMFDHAYRLWRIEATGQVPVYGYEIVDGLSVKHRQMIEQDREYLLGPDGKLFDHN